MSLITLQVEVLPRLTRASCRLPADRPGFLNCHIVLFACRLSASRARKRLQSPRRNRNPRLLLDHPARRSHRACLPHSPLVSRSLRASPCQGARVSRQVALDPKPAREQSLALQAQALLQVSRRVKAHPEVKHRRRLSRSHPADHRGRLCYRVPVRA